MYLRLVMKKFVITINQRSFIRYHTFDFIVYLYSEIKRERVRCYLDFPSKRGRPLIYSNKIDPYNSIVDETLDLARIGK